MIGMNSMSNINFQDIFMKKWEDYHARVSKTVTKAQLSVANVISPRLKKLWNTYKQNGEKFLVEGRKINFRTGG